MRFVREKIAIVVCDGEPTSSKVKAIGAFLASWDWNLPVISKAAPAADTIEMALVGSERGTHIYRPDGPHDVLVYAIDSTREDLADHLKALLRVGHTQKAVFLLFTSTGNGAEILRTATSAVFTHLPPSNRSPVSVSINHHYRRWLERRNASRTTVLFKPKPSFLIDFAVSRSVFSPDTSSFETPLGSISLTPGGSSWQEGRLLTNPLADAPVFFGPYATLQAGTYEVIFEVAPVSGFAAAEIYVDVVVSEGFQPVTGRMFSMTRDMADTRQALAVIFEFTGQTDGVETRLWHVSGDGIVPSRYTLRRLD